MVLKVDTTYITLLNIFIGMIFFFKDASLADFGVDIISPFQRVLNEFSNKGKIQYC